MNNNQLVNSGYPVLPFFTGDHGLDSLFSVTLSGSSALVAGTVLGRISSSGKYAAYDNNASDGTEVARGILFNRVDPSTNPLGSMMVHGMVRSGSLTGYDANAKTDLAEFVFV
jgi:hypothetical protein